MSGVIVGCNCRSSWHLGISVFHCLLPISLVREELTKEESKLARFCLSAVKQGTIQQKRQFLIPRTFTEVIEYLRHYFLCTISPPIFLHGMAALNIMRTSRSSLRSSTPPRIPIRRVLSPNPWTVCANPRTAEAGSTILSMAQESVTYG